MSLTYVDMAGGKCSVQSSPMDSRLQFKAVIVSDQSAPCFCLVHSPEREDPGCWDSEGNCSQIPNWTHHHHNRRSSVTFSGLS